MITENPAARRDAKTLRLSCDLVVVGGGLAGVCCSITAARAGLKVVLAQDRPVLGGNASSEVRLWILGATSHMGNNNRWAREGGVIGEILVENMFRNPEGNPLMVDALLLDKVAGEPNITLLLNTVVHDLEKSGPDAIQSVRAFCSQNSTAYEMAAPFFCDASGDGIVGFLAGAAFRMGVEAKSEFGEHYAPAKPSSELLGHTIYFYSKDTGRPVKFIPPNFAIKDITKIPRWRDIQVGDYGCRFWWLEWGGRYDTVHDTEMIKWELWRVVYGVWNFIKNSGKFPAAETMTLEWVGTIPGKRESRRFEGDYILTQPDIVEQRQHEDAVSYGGWAIDLHPADGVFSKKPPCTQWHAKGVYQIPFRCYYSRNIRNLFLAGRIISASHIAFGSTRVMATGAHGAQAVALAAALCKRENVLPRDLLASRRMRTLQRDLLRAGQHIPSLGLEDAEDLAAQATLAASSELKLSFLKPNGETQSLERSAAMMLPLGPGRVPRVTLFVDASQATDLCAELRISSKPQNHTPDVTLGVLQIPLSPGRNQAMELDFKAVLERPSYAFFCLLANDKISVHLSEQRLTGVLALMQKFHKSVATQPRQEPPANSGLDSFEFWLPQRRPGGKSFALKMEPPLAVFGVENLINGLARPSSHPNAWVASFEDEQPSVALTWPKPQTIGRIELAFDTDYDHPMESVLLGHPETTMPFCVQSVVVFNGEDFRPAVPAGSGQPDNDGAERTPGHRQRGGNAIGSVAIKAIARIENNYQTRQSLKLEPAITTTRLVLHLTAPRGPIPAALFEIRCYEQ